MSLIVNSPTGHLKVKDNGSYYSFERSDEPVSYKVELSFDLRLDKSKVETIVSDSVITFKNKETSNNKSAASMHDISLPRPTIQSTLEQATKDGYYYLDKISTSYPSYTFDLPPGLLISFRNVKGNYKSGKIIKRDEPSPDRFYVQWDERSFLTIENFDEMMKDKNNQRLQLYPINDLRLNAGKVSYTIDTENLKIVFSNQPPSAGGKMKMSRERPKKSLYRKKKVKHISSKSGYKRK